MVLAMNIYIIVWFSLELRHILRDIVYNICSLRVHLSKFTHFTHVSPDPHQGDMHCFKKYAWICSYWLGCPVRMSDFISFSYCWTHRSRIGRGSKPSGLTNSLILWTSLNIYVHTGCLGLSFPLSLFLGDNGKISLPTNVQDYIDNYMETAKSSKSTGSPGGDEIDENFEDEDRQSQEDFVEFMPSGSGVKGGSSDVSMPPPAPPMVAGCKCFKNPCDFQWNSSLCLCRSYNKENSVLHTWLL